MFQMNRSNTGGFGTQNTGSTSLFGQNNTNQGTSALSFGAQNNQQAQGNTGGLFGTQQNNQQQQPGGGLFGQHQNQNQNQNQQPGGGLFGQNQTQNQNQQQAGGLFGQNNQSGTSGGLFGSSSSQPQQGSTGLFGNKPAGSTTGGLFGQSQTQQTQPGQTGGLFGNSNTQTGATNTTGSLFGSKPTASGGLFGNQGTSNTAPAASGGLFGSAPTAASNTGGGLFGNNQQPGASTSTGGGLFGSKPAGTTTSGGLFGAKPTGTSTGGLFGNTATQPQTSGGLFGNNNQQNTFSGGSLSQPSFGLSNTATQGTLGQQSLVQPQNQQPQLAAQQLQSQQLSRYPQLIQEQILKCKESWDSNSYKTSLRSFVYNKVNETDAILYTKPTNVSQEEWDKAIENKPSSDLIPIQVFGFEGLNNRNQIQVENVAQARVILNQILDKTKQLQQSHSFETSARIMKVQARNAQIEKRILKLGTQLAILKNRRLPLTISEEKMWGQFQELLKSSNDPAGLGKTNELWARLAVLRERAKTISEQLDSKLVIIGENGGQTGKPSASGDNNRVSDEVYDRIDKIAEILKNQQSGIAYLNDVLEKDNKALDSVVELK